MHEILKAMDHQVLFQAFFIRLSLYFEHKYVIISFIYINTDITHRNPDNAENLKSSEIYMIYMIYSIKEKKPAQILVFLLESVMI